MAQTTKKGAPKRGRPKKKPEVSVRTKTATKPMPRSKPAEKNLVAQNIAPFLLVVVSAYMLAAFFLSGESVGGIGVFTRNIFYGSFGAVAVLVPIFMVVIAILLKKDIASGFFKYRLIFSAICLVFYASMFHLGWKDAPQAGFGISEIFENGTLSNGGGVFGGYLAEILRLCVGRVGAWIFVLPLSIVFSTFLFGYTPPGLIKQIMVLISDYRATRPQKTISTKEKQQKIPKPKTIEIPEIDDSPFLDDNPFLNDFTEETSEIFEQIEQTKNGEDGANREDSIFELFEKEAKEKEAEEPEQIEELKLAEPAEQERLDSPDIIDGDEPEGKIPAKKEYKLPPISYLTKETSNANQDISEELRTTAQKLKDTLASFGVKTKISDYSRGPSITRYEISPETGVKVNSIGSLANDISLHLAAEVRIEAPIPGKSAIGVEVPNKVREIVYLRSLLEDPQFANAASKITIALGMDVAGKPIYSDIAKMPHLLIAGATNMGKSVFMNSVIASILYKSTPDEVKFIMIDPKKVELNIYNGIPHLLVPVVSDPKKAAGALAWAVNEMENRYMLIEERGVRDFKSYNESISGDPLSEPLPQIVIIIDELADLMLTAPADVEQSVNRLAAKARAAGLHLIVATQRPSVDVITGLIKANIPTRIAFTVVAPQDSRTIISMGGAEKLIGVGDMLYVPTGSKPIRVQGAYISDNERINVVNFWKAQSDGQYDETIADEIEQEAARCNTKGAKIKDKEEGLDPDDEFKKDSMLKSAIEVALDNGRISTSLLQTKLSLGYARAARIVDTMEKMGIIGPFEGSKPRKLLIGRQEFIEMTMRSENFE